MRNLFAFTENTQESYPGYISLNVDVDGTVYLHTRGRGSQGGEVIELSEKELIGLESAINKLINEKYNAKLNP